MEIVLTTATRYHSLDGLRALSILIVMAAHFVSGKYFPGGVGVLIFFCISGFLITWLMFKEFDSHGRIDIADFFLRRIFRLYPALLVYVAVSIGWAILFKPSVSVDWWEVAAALFYFSNLYYFTGIFGFDGAPTMPFHILWSLSVEEHFYLLFPFIFVALHARARAFMMWCLALSVLALLLRLMSSLSLSNAADVNYYLSPWRMDSIFAGVCVAVIFRAGGGGWCQRVVNGRFALSVCIFLFAFSLAIRDDFFRETVRYTIQSFAAALLVAVSVFSSRYVAWKRFLESRFLVWIGRLSYSLYLWHYFVMVSFAPKSSDPVIVVGKIGLSFLLAYVSYSFVEEPGLKLRSRLLGRKRYNTVHS